MDPVSSFVEKAKALQLLKAALGDVFESQKQILLDQVLKLPIADAGATLNQLCAIKFIQSDEVATCTVKLLGFGPTVPSPAPVNVWSNVDLSYDTPVTQLEKPLTSLFKKDAHNFIQNLYSTLEIQTVRELLLLDERERQFSIVSELLSEDDFEFFKKTISELKTHPFFTPEKKKSSEPPQTNEKEHEDDEDEKNKKKNVIYHFWSYDENQTQVLLLPLKEKLYFFCSSAKDVSLEKVGEHVFFILDTSSSMNHNEKGKYLPPESPDHPSSSIRKARDLVPSLALAAIKREIPATLILWNSQVDKTINFLPSDYQDKETGDWTHDDQLIKDDLTKRCDGSIFVAQGATNIEAILKHIGKELLKIANNLTNVVVWFLTDGEETWCNDKNGSAIPIPRAANSPERPFYNDVKSDGLTGYQKSLVDHMSKVRGSLTEYHCTMEFHICHFGEANAAFLSSLRNAVDGHFHAVADLTKLEQEMASAATGTNSRISIMSPNSGQAYTVPAAVTEGQLLGRGELPLSLTDEVVPHRQLIVRLSEKSDSVLKLASTIPLDKHLTEGFSRILSLEINLGKIIASISGDISPANLDRASGQLGKLREQRIAAIGNLVRFVRSGSFVQTFLEKVLEAVDNQVQLLERMIGQHNSSMTTQYDTSVAQKEEYFNQREQMAIAAGLESMRVRLGNGFVAKSNLDKHVQRLVATNGPWARKMLNRVSLLGRTNHDGGETSLTLLILDGDYYKRRRQELTQKLISDNPAAVELANLPSTITEVEETLFHNTSDHDRLYVNLVVTLTYDDRTLRLNVSSSADDVYPTVVTKYSRRVRTDDLEDACTRFCDPLSLRNVLELIQESGTLPAYLYVVGSTQSPGLIFNAKELLYVTSGGAEMTSFGYFRLYWRLAQKSDEEKGLVKVPGSMFEANSALPIAPEPLTNLVLSNLMVGVFSELITGTPMAPLTESGLLYTGYLLMHMRSDMSGMNVTRMVEILSAMECWMENPETNPKLEEIGEITGKLIEKTGIFVKDSPGKYIPIKAFIYGILDENFPLEAKMRALQHETWRRYFNLFLGKSRSATTHVPKKIAEVQISGHKFAKILVREFVKLPEFSEIISEDSEVPVSFIAAAESISHIAHLKGDNPENREKILQFLSDEKRRAILVKSLSEIIHVNCTRALGETNRWYSFQRLLYVWHVLASLSIKDLTKVFSDWKRPTEFETYVTKKLQIINENNLEFKSTLVSWVEKSPEKNDWDYFTLDISSSAEEGGSDGVSLVIRNVTRGIIRKVDEKTDSGPLLIFWEYFGHVLRRYSWGGRSSDGHGLLKLDYEIIKALRDTTGTLVSKLTPPQLLDYNAAIEWRSARYTSYAPPKPVLERPHTIEKVTARPISDKLRLSVILIGAIHCGKSTTAGHLISELGFVDKRTLDRYEDDCRKIRNNSEKFAWIMNQLKDERERGLTVTVGLWNISTAKYEVDIHDAPGHKSYIKNMTVATSLADVAILVVSAAPGEFENGIAKDGMTRLEAMVAINQGVRTFIVAVNKMDLETVNYSQERFEEVKKETLRVLKLLGHRNPEIPVIPISGWIGDNLIRPSEKFQWWKGHTLSSGETVVTLLEAIDSVTPPPRATTGPLRVTLNLIYPTGHIVTGRVVSGTLKVGDEVAVFQDPVAHPPLHVASIEIFYTNRKFAIPGDIIGIQFREKPKSPIVRGDVIGPAKDRLRPVTRFVAKMRFYHPGSMRVGWSPYFFSHTCCFTGRFAEFHQKLNQSGQVIEESPTSFKNGEFGVVVISVQTPVFLEPYKDMPPLGRVVVYDVGNLAAVGAIQSVERGMVESKSKTGLKKQLYDAKGKRYH